MLQASATSFIHSDFKTSHYRYLREILEILRKLFFLGLITVILPIGSAMQLFASQLVAITWLLVLFVCRPFKSVVDNAVAVGCSFSLHYIRSMRSKQVKRYQTMHTPIHLKKGQTMTTT